MRIGLESYARPGLHSISQNFVTLRLHLNLKAKPLPNWEADTCSSSFSHANDPSFRIPFHDTVL